MRFLLVTALPQEGSGHVHLVLDPHLATSNPPRVRPVGVKAAPPRPEPVMGRHSTPTHPHKAAGFIPREQVIADHANLRKEAGKTLAILAEVDAPDQESAEAAFKAQAEAKQAQDAARAEAQYVAWRAANVPAQVTHTLTGLGLSGQALGEALATLREEGLVIEHPNENGHPVFFDKSAPAGVDPHSSLVHGLTKWVKSRATNPQPAAHAAEES
jgi:hypothetical protein